ncbi:MAG: hypothetical protein CMH41_04300 [Micrococcales bacterium]|nr:hypothetical protein [Micrococcales bacterium]
MVGVRNAIILDYLVVAFFVLIGLLTHDGRDGLVGYLRVAAPFLLSLAMAWLIVGRTKLQPGDLPTGITVAVITWGLGLAIRAIVFSGGVALPFVLVAGGFLIAGMLGWRTVTTWRSSAAGRKRKG